MLALLTTRLFGRLPALAGWLAASPTATGGPGAAMLTGVAAAAAGTRDGIGLPDLAPILIAMIAAGGTLGVALINNRRQRPAPPPPPPAPADEDLPTSASVRVLEANIAGVHRAGVDGRTALAERIDGVDERLDQLCRRFEEHLDRGTGRIPAQRRPTD